MSRACLRADIVFDEMMTGPEEKEASILQTDPLFLDILFVFSSFFLRIYTFLLPRTSGKLFCLFFLVCLALVRGLSGGQTI